MKESFNYNLPVRPTRYAGREYRSKLEAIWAVFFKEIGVKAYYEEHSFGNYIPDFYSEFAGGLFYEVKPENGISYEALEKSQWVDNPFTFLVGPPDFIYYPRRASYRYCEKCGQLHFDRIKCRICGEEAKWDCGWAQAAFCCKSVTDVRSKSSITPGNIIRTSALNVIERLSETAFSDDYRRAVEVANNYKF